jgi:predicted dinucleotide-binding enzyme
VMVRPEMIAGDHLAFLCGDSAEAKVTASELLTAFGWRSEQLMDLGGIDAAAATEMMMAIWMRVTLARGLDAPRFNWAILSADR